MSDKPTVDDLLSKSLLAHDMVVNLMRALRDEGRLPPETGIGIMRAAISSANPPPFARGELEGEIERWEIWSR